MQQPFVGAILHGELSEEDDTLQFGNQLAQLQASNRLTKRVECGAMSYDCVVSNLNPSLVSIKQLACVLDPIDTLRQLPGVALPALSLHCWTIGYDLGLRKNELLLLFV